MLIRVLAQTELFIIRPLELACVCVWDTSVSQSFGLLGSLAIITLTMPPFVLLLPPLALVYYRLQGFYRATSREVRNGSSISIDVQTER